MLKSAGRGFALACSSTSRASWRAVDRFAEGFRALPSLDWYFAARNPALARRVPDSIEQRIAATLWLERHFAQLYRLDYPPLYFMQALRRPVQFKAVWQLPVNDDRPRLLYVADAWQAFVRYFFGNEIQPGSGIGQADAPRPAYMRYWRTDDELEDCLQAAGYCVQLYPERSHIEAYCRLAHEGEHVTSQVAAGRLQARTGGEPGLLAQPINLQSAEPAQALGDGLGRLR